MNTTWTISIICIFPSHFLSVIAYLNNLLIVGNACFCHIVRWKLSLGHSHWIRALDSNPNEKIHWGRLNLHWAHIELSKRGTQTKPMDINSSKWFKLMVFDFKMLRMPLNLTKNHYYIQFSTILIGNLW